MPMERDKHEELLSELLNPELEHSRRTDILQQLRVDYGSVHSEHKELSETRDKLKADNEDLILSNSKLFRQIGVTGGDDEKKQEKKEFSETVTVAQLTKE